MKTLGVIGGMSAESTAVYDDLLNRLMGDQLAEQRIEAIVPDAGERPALHALIYDELCQGRGTSASQAPVLAMIDRTRRDAGAVAFALG